MNEQKITILPCPFCGSEASSSHVDVHDEKYYSCSDPSCPAFGDESSVPAVIWNSRHPENKSSSITLNAKELREAAYWANPDLTEDEDETEVQIHWITACTSTDGEAMASGHYLSYIDCPEEGVIGPLGEDPMPDAALLPAGKKQSESSDVSGDPQAFRFGTIDMDCWPPIRWNEGIVRADVLPYDGMGVYAGTPQSPRVPDVGQVKPAFFVQKAVIEKCETCAYFSVFIYSDPQFATPTHDLIGVYTHPQAAVMPDHWAEKNPGLADQYRAEALRCRNLLGFASHAEDVSPSELGNEIVKLINAAQQKQPCRYHDGDTEACETYSGQVPCDPYPLAYLCREVYSDHPEMDSDWFDHQPIQPGSKMHRHREQSAHWELLPVVAESFGTQKEESSPEIPVNEESLVRPENSAAERCHAGKDGECFWDQCPQIRDNEPETSRRHCPLDTQGDPYL